MDRFTNIQHRLERYGERPELTVRHLAAATGIEIALPAAAVDLTIADDVFEWFVDVRRSPDGEPILADWMDHYAVDGEADCGLEAEMMDEVCAFIGALMEHPTRIIQGSHGGWQLESFRGAWLCLLPFRMAFSQRSTDEDVEER